MRTLAITLCGVHRGMLIQAAWNVLALNNAVAEAIDRECLPDYIEGMNAAYYQACNEFTRQLNNLNGNAFPVVDDNTQNIVGVALGIYIAAGNDFSLQVL